MVSQTRNAGMNEYTLSHYAQQHCRTMLRDAEHHRLVRSLPQRAYALHQAMAAVGTRLVHWGEQLRQRAARPAEPAIWVSQKAQL